MKSFSEKEQQKDVPRLTVYAMNKYDQNYNISYILRESIKIHIRDKKNY